MSDREPWQLTRAEWNAAVAAIGVPHGGDRSAGAIVARIARRRRLRMGLPDRVCHGLPVPAQYDDVLRHARALGHPVPEDAAGEAT